MLGAGSGVEDADVIFDRCLKVVQHIYRALQLRSKYVCHAYLLTNQNVFFLFLLFSTSSLVREAKYCDDCVCLLVSLSVCLLASISAEPLVRSPQIFVRVTLAVA